MSPAVLTIMIGSAWIVLAIPLVGRVLRADPARRDLSPRAGARCLVGALLGLLVFAVVIWATRSFPPILSAVASLVTHAGVGFFLVAYAQHLEPSADVLGILPAPRASDVARGVAGYACFLPLVVAIHYFNARLMGRGPDVTQDALRDLVAEAGTPRFWLLVVTAVIAVPVYEETLFRGLLQQGFAAHLSAARGAVAARFLSILITSLVFTALHEPFAFVPVFVLSLLLGTAYARTRRLAVPIALHASHNLAVVIHQVYCPWWTDALGLGP